MDESEVDEKRQLAEKLLAEGKYQDAKDVAEEVHSLATESGDRDLREEMEYFTITVDEQERKETEGAREAISAGEIASEAPANEVTTPAKGVEYAFTMNEGTQEMGPIRIPVGDADTTPEHQPSRKVPAKEVLQVEEGEIPWGQGIVRETYQWAREGAEFDLKKAWPAREPAEQYINDQVSGGKSAGDIKLITVVRKNYAGQYCFNAKGETFAVYER